MRIISESLGPKNVYGKLSRNVIVFRSYLSRYEFNVLRIFRLPNPPQPRHTWFHVFTARAFEEAKELCGSADQPRADWNRKFRIRFLNLFEQDGPRKPNGLFDRNRTSQPSISKIRKESFFRRRINANGSPQFSKRQTYDSGRIKAANDPYTASFVEIDSPKWTSR